MAKLTNEERELLNKLINSEEEKEQEVDGSEFGKFCNAVKLYCDNNYSDYTEISDEAIKSMYSSQIIRDAFSNYVEEIKYLDHNAEELFKSVDAAERAGKTVYNESDSIKIDIKADSVRRELIYHVVELVRESEIVVGNLIFFAKKLFPKKIEIKRH